MAASRHLGFEPTGCFTDWCHEKYRKLERGVVMHDNNVNLISEIYGYSNGKTENSSILTGPLWFDDNKFLHALPCTADT